MRRSSSGTFARNSRGNGIEAALRSDRSVQMIAGGYTPLSGLGQVIKRGRNAAFLVRYSGNGQPHFHPAQRARQHEIVEIAEMAYAEYPVLQLAETCTERHIELLQNHFAELVCGMPCRRI